MSSKRKSFHYGNNSEENTKKIRSFLLDTLDVDDHILESQIMLTTQNKKK
jgi:hypothetical protein